MTQRGIPFDRSVGMILKDGVPVRKVLAEDIVEAFIALQIEERDLTDMYGDTYREYKQEVSMLIPLPKKK